MTPTKTDPNPNAVKWTWPHLTQADDTGDALGGNFIDYVDRSVQIEGTFDGASVVIEGSNDGVHYHTLTDPQGVAISKAVAAIVQTTEMVIDVRPRLVSAGASTDITVTIAARKAQFR